jgi:hypothetical protein
MTMTQDKVIAYGDLIAESTRDFVGRGWVRDAVAEFLRAEGPTYFLLLGEPGRGKTAFMADLVRQHGYPHHFIGRGCRLDLEELPQWRSPVRLAESLGCQLVREYGGWIMSWDDWGIAVRQEVKDLKGRLIGAQIPDFHGMPHPAANPLVYVEQTVDRSAPVAEVIAVFIEKFQIDVKELMSELLLKPLGRIADRFPDRQLVLVIDGLDEADEYMGGVSCSSCPRAGCHGLFACSCPPDPEGTSLPG